MRPQLSDASDDLDSEEDVTRSVRGFFSPDQSLAAAKCSTEPGLMVAAVANAVCLCASFSSSGKAAMRTGQWSDGCVLDVAEPVIIETEGPARRSEYMQDVCGRSRANSGRRMMVEALVLDKGGFNSSLSGIEPELAKNDQELSAAAGEIKGQEAGPGQGSLRQRRPDGDLEERKGKCGPGRLDHRLLTPKAEKPLWETRQVDLQGTYSLHGDYPVYNLPYGLDMIFVRVVLTHKGADTTDMGIVHEKALFQR
ncbi:hypothetical protein V8F20_005410 [Naviculisporaceae sp. PSN 640]